MTNSTLANRLWPQTQSAELLRIFALAVFGSLLVAGAAQIEVPMIPVPMTLQTLAVLAVGSAYGARLGAATLALYTTEGAVGIPVFAQMKTGLAVIGGPTGGYIVGFIIAAALVGYLSEKNWDRSFVKMFAAAILGALVLYLPGLVWLHQFANGWRQTLEWGIMPFLIGDLIKAALVALGYWFAWGWIKEKS